MDEWSCADGKYGHCQRVSLSCALLGKDGLSVDVQISVNARSIDKDFCEWWTEMEDVRAVWRLKELKALQASTWITASNCGRLNSCCMACTATSYPPSKPAQSWSGPTVSWMRVMDIAFSMIRRRVSPIAIGLTPGHLSSAINLRTVLVVVPTDEAILSRGSRPPLSWSVINRKAALTFPAVINLENL